MPLLRLLCRRSGRKQFWKECRRRLSSLVVFRRKSGGTILGQSPTRSCQAASGRSMRVTPHWRVTSPSSHCFVCRPVATKSQSLRTASRRWSESGRRQCHRCRTWRNSISICVSAASRNRTGPAAARLRQSVFDSSETARLLRHYRSTVSTRAFAERRRSTSISLLVSTR